MTAMVDFDLFVKTLGPHAKLYTHEELVRLHGEVRKLAEILLAVQQRRKKSLRFPQPSLDAPGSDRTMTQRPPDSP